MVHQEHPVIKSGFERHILPIAIGSAGLAVALVTGELSGLLVAVTGISLLGGRRVSLALTAIFGLASAACVAAGWHSLGEHEGNLVVFLAVGLGISGLIGTALRSNDAAEVALRESERRLRQLIDAVPALIWCTTPQGIPCYLNKRVTDATGVTLKDMIAPDGSRSLTVIHPEDRDAIDQALARSFETGAPFLGRYRQRRSNGHRWVESRAEPLRDETGAILQWYGVSVDIEDTMMAQAALRDRERELSQLVDMVPSHVWRLTPDGEPTFFNKRMVDFLGLEVADTGKPGMSRLDAVVDAVVHPDDAAAFADALNRSLATGESFAMRYRLRRADGVYRWMSSRAEPMRDHAGRILHWHGLCHDIDDQMHAEQALRRSERQLQQLVDAVPVNIWCLTPEGTPSYFNKRVVDQIGLLVDDLTLPDGSLSLASVHPDDRPGVQRALRHSLETGEPFGLKYRQRRGKADYRWTEGRAEPLRDEDGRIVQWYGVYLDIDDEVAAQQALQEREHQLTQLVNIVPALIWCLMPDGDPSYFNRRLIDYFGLDVADIDTPGASRLAATIAAIVHPDDAVALTERLTRSLTTGQSFSFRYRLRRSDGIYRWIEGRAEPMRNRDGDIVQWYGLCFDVEDEIRTQEALRERERFLWQLVETLPAMIDCSAPDGEPIYRSQQLREFLGYNLEELDGTGKSRLAGTLDAGVHPDDLAGVKEKYARSLATGEPYARRHRLRRFDGEYRWVETRAAPMRNAQGAIVQWNVICLDVDGEVRTMEKLRLAQEGLARASQAASLAELSASIAHEVNQPLAAIVATSHACRRWLSADPPNLERAKITLERIIRDANSASEVVSRIRALFNRMGKARSAADITEVMTEVCRLMADELAIKNIRVETELDRGLPSALIDRVQIQQVLANLMRNAIDALEGIGDGARVIQLRSVLDGESHVRVEVRDFGTGLKQPERIFEPFFTTKANGMGMGLAICRSIIESHNGRLSASSNEPRGTTFAFTLPTAAREAAA